MLGTVVDASVLAPKRPAIRRGSEAHLHFDAPSLRVRLRVLHTPFLRTLLWFQPSTGADLSVHRLKALEQTIA